MKRTIIKEPGSLSKIVKLKREGEERKVLALVDGRKKGRYEVEIVIDHMVGDNKGDVQVRAVAQNGAELVIKGMVKIRENSRKAEDFLDVRVLLLDDESRAFVDPQLEIESDDVKVSHAVSVGRVDEDQLFYLVSRGVDRNRAMEMIVEGFLGEYADK